MSSFFGLVLPSHVGLQFPRYFCSPRLADKPLSIELSVGTFGNSLEVSVEKKSIAIKKTKKAFTLMYYFDIGLIFKISPPGSIFIKPILNVKGPPPNDLHCDLSGFEDDTGKPENNF